MTKIKGNLRIVYSSPTEQTKLVFEVAFAPYHGRLKTQVVKFHDQDELILFLLGLKMSDDDAPRWAGKARAEGLVLVPDVQLTEAQLKESGLIT